MTPISLDPVVLVLVVTILVIFAYSAGQRKARFYPIPRRGYTTPDLRQLVVYAKYRVTGNIDDIELRLRNGLNPSYSANIIDSLEWGITRQGNVIRASYLTVRLRPRSRFRRNRKRASDDEYFRRLAATRHGVPHDLRMVGTNLDGAWEFEVTVRPVLYYQVTQGTSLECTEQDIQEGAT